MSFTTNQNSLLFQLRGLMPCRPLAQAEALRIAELQANRLLAACDVTGAGTPSDVVRAFPNVRVSKRSDLPASGYTDWYKPYWRVYLNANEPSVRQRFSLFHELKHVIDHPFIDSCYPAHWNVSSSKRAELVADYFAACVLMPKRFVRSAYFQGQHDVSELAATFGVSTVAMTFRLQQLGIVDRVRRCEHGQRPLPKLPGYFRQAWDHTSLVAV
jgi:predicted transcriptional regulator